MLPFPNCLPSFHTLPLISLIPHKRGIGLISTPHPLPNPYYTQFHLLSLIQNLPASECRWKCKQHLHPSSHTHMLLPLPHCLNSPHNFQFIRWCTLPQQASTRTPQRIGWLENPIPEARPTPSSFRMPMPPQLPRHTAHATSQSPPNSFPTSKSNYSTNPWASFNPNSPTCCCQPQISRTCSLSYRCPLTFPNLSRLTTTLKLTSYHNSSLW